MPIVRISESLVIPFSNAEVDQYMKDTGLDKIVNENSHFISKEELFSSAIRGEVAKMIKEQILNKKAYQRNQKIEKLLS